jgi:hypothetical protein
MRTQVLLARLSTLFLIAISCVIVFWAVSAYGTPTPDDWFRLVLDLQNTKRDCLDKDDRDFLRNMINLMTLDDFGEPNAIQKKWILAIKKECKFP